ncbi:eCIS core domain-containing protein [Thermococcus pacificus]|uniref:eCIS core domain-containing protein n=1 Tax=Thermococcus pacificus TaxID=71998 RepID=A0A218P5I4_9EURY|nr:hypothetical protein [Thermococcus pacificus]ASJ06011.1 hypothetical protein A3L08_01015 [Thermococcus pacificus]
MRKPHDRILALVLLGVLLLSLYSAVRLNTHPNAVLDQVNLILSQVQEIRGLNFKEPPQIVVITRAKALEMWKPGKPDLERLHREELVYKMTLLLPPDYDYIKEEHERSAGWIAATVGNTIYIIRENFMGDLDTARRTVAHESVHVLQKQWFDAKYGADTFDGTLAVQALVEGDADLVADIYCKRNGIPIHKIRSLSGDPLTDVHIFPYVFGDSFVRYLYERGNWTLVNGAYTRYPRTTLEVMEPELYLKNFTPVNVALSPPNGSQVLRDDRMGAFYVYVLLKDVAKLDNETAWNVSTAWLGDRLILARTSDGYVLLWGITFSNEGAAEEFTETLKKLAQDNSYASREIYVDGKTVLLKAVRRE